MKNKRVRALVIRLYPNKEQERIMNEHLSICCGVYNQLLEHCKQCYEKGEKHPSSYDLQNMLPEMKRKDPKLKLPYAQVLSDVSHRLSKAFDGFFRRVKEDPEHSGYPRFKSWKRYDSMTYTQNGFIVDNGHLELSKVGNIPIKGFRKMEGKLKTCTIERKGVGPNYRWVAILTYESDMSKKRTDEMPYNPPRSDQTVGIDLGLRNIVVTSDGEQYSNRKNFIQSERQISRILRRMSGYEKGSPQREKYRQRLFHAFERLNNVNKGYLYGIVNDLIEQYETIIMEDLNVRRIADKSRSKGMRKSFRDANWSRFIFILGYKAEEAGVRLVKVDPAYTSQLCSQCGMMVPKALSERRHQCPLCGLDVDRD